VATGRVLQFDQARGYGFVAADDGGEDVFLHASVFDGETDELAPGAKVEFKIMSGDRGRKAFAAHYVDEPDPGDTSVPAPRPVPVPPSVPAPRLAPAHPVAASGLTSAPQPTQALSASASDVPDQKQVADDEQMCDVLSPTEFGQELTELLLRSVPSLTGQQVLDVRQGILECASKHGWVDI
jgi:CspA family cold shock protein